MNGGLTWLKWTVAVLIVVFLIATSLYVLILIVAVAWNIIDDIRSGFPLSSASGHSMPVRLHYSSTYGCGCGYDAQWIPRSVCPVGYEQEIARSGVRYVGPSQAAAALHSG